MFVAHRAQSGHDSSFHLQHCTRSSVICSGEGLGKSESCVKMCALCPISCGIIKQVTRNTLWTHPTASVGISYTSGRSVMISEVILERYKIRESINEQTNWYSGRAVRSAIFFYLLCQHHVEEIFVIHRQGGRDHKVNGTIARCGCLRRLTVT